MRDTQPGDAVHIAALDDHPIVIEGLLALLRRAMPEVVWEGNSATWREFHQRLADGEIRPGIVLYDIHLHDGSIPEDGVADLVDRGVKVIVLTSELRPVPVRRVVRAGAVGLVLKSDPVDRLVDVVSAVARDEFAVSSDLAFVLITDDELAPRLAPRELEVLTLLASGVPRKSIGSKMNPPVALATVVTYLNRICARYRALGRHVDTPQDAVRAAIQDGYLDLPEGERDL